MLGPEQLPEADQRPGPDLLGRTSRDPQPGRDLVEGPVVLVVPADDLAIPCGESVQGLVQRPTTLAAHELGAGGRDGARRRLRAAGPAGLPGSPWSLALVGRVMTPLVGQVVEQDRLEPGAPRRLGAPAEARDML